MFDRIPIHDYIFFFFFQAEDGIRDTSVTGVQTCALPIYTRQRWCSPCSGLTRITSATTGSSASRGSRRITTPRRSTNGSRTGPRRGSKARSEERRVGKRVDLGGGGMTRNKRETR